MLILQTFDDIVALANGLFIGDRQVREKISADAALSRLMARRYGRRATLEEKIEFAKKNQLFFDEHGNIYLVQKVERK